jgi:hypothetical protein
MQSTWAPAWDGWEDGAEDDWEEEEWQDEEGWWHNNEPAEGADLAALGGWLVAQSGGPTPAFQQLTKRLKQLAHGAEFDKLMRLLGDVTAAGTKGMPSPAQADALGALARVFRTA